VYAKENHFHILHPRLTICSQLHESIKKIIKTAISQEIALDKQGGSRGL